MDFVVYINGHEHYVARSAIAAFRDRILDAVRAGGAFVNVPELERSDSVELITPATPVRIETAPKQITAYDENVTADTAYYDLDPWDPPEWLNPLAD